MRAGDARAALQDAVARQSAGLTLVARLESLAGALEESGFGVDLDIDLLSVGRASVLMQVEIPAGLADAAPGVEVAAERVPAAVKPAQRAKVKGRAAGRGPRWSEADKAQLVEMVARGVAPVEIARRLGRPLPGTRKMISNLTAKGPNSRRKGGEVAVEAAAPVVRPEPVAESEPAPVPPAAPPIVGVVVSAADVVEAAPKPEAGAGSGRVSAQSPIEGMDAGDVTAAMFKAHLLWLYGGALDRDQLACDLELVELLLTTGSAQAVAQEFDWPKEQVIARWGALRHGLPVTLDLQARLHGALRALSARAA
ncbi:hypothetical protein [Roseinatronobacter bogoriensis]|uniref:hypothetical protein n=1 Tax=Roseinatronobacter bogoriensis TaxID=119542 RepID=UPI001064FD12|nr:hypothetical protein [Rhodobaca bogoriensis]MBB4207257.1 transposase-like protein [Rhodobaca bogoriensis DSM 18756]TDY65757.1 hypothetical protein EV660_11725 [Rhodobaca bogoriensis DSM 18756]